MRKKGLAIAVLVLLCGSLCALLLPVDLLPIAKASPGMALSTGGTAYLAYNDEKYSTIIGVDADGRVLTCYREKNRVNGERTAVGALAEWDGCVYFIRARGNVGLADFSGWELASLDPASGEAAVLLRDNTAGLRVSSLSVSDGMVYLGCIRQSRKAGAPVDVLELYRLNPADENAALLLVLSADVPAGKMAVSAVHSGGGTLCALLSDGSLVRSSGQGTQLVALPEEAMPLGELSAASGYLWVRGAQQGQFLTGTSARLHSRTLSENVLSGVATPSQLVMRVMAGENGAVALTRSAGESVTMCTRLHVPLTMRLRLRWPVMAATFAVLLALLLTRELLHRLLRSHRLHIRMTTGAVGLCAVFCVAVGLVAAGFMARAQSGQTAFEAAWYAQNAAMRLQNGVVVDQSGQLTAGGQALGELLAMQTDDAGAAVSYAVYTDGGDGPRPVFVSRDQIAVEPQVTVCVNEAWSRGYASAGRMLLEGRRTSVCAVPVRQVGEVTAVTVYLVTSGDGSGAFADFLWQLAGVCTLLLALCALLLALLMKKQLSPLAPLAAQMDRLALGDTNLETISCTDDELGRLWRSLKELSVGVAIRDYETGMTLEACRRFVPHGLERLLDRGSITEVAFGDLTVTDGAIGLITVANGARMRAALDDRGFMDYVNRCFLTISRSIRPQGGVLLTSGFDLGAIRVLFTEQADKGVRALLSLLGEVYNGGAKAPDCFALLHKTRFLYGVAGAEDEAFPYLASSEISFFSGKLPLLAEIGCRLVMTDAYMETLREQYSTRYIGFLSADEGRVLCKLYEVLDGYGELERAKRVQYDARLQEAIRCFYQNDFYLARNLLLAILRLCPDDGVARWYLFACEHYFNAGAGEQVRYDLFGVKH